MSCAESSWRGWPTARRARGDAVGEAGQSEPSRGAAS
jgi:hypothetical protein